jgi:hypothetical protein
MNLEQLLAELMQDADFAAMPEGWRTEIAQQILDTGLRGAAQTNADWAAANANDPGAAALARWAQKATQAADQIDPGGPAMPGAGAGATPGGGDVPLEQDLLNSILPGLLTGVESDAGRQQLIDKLLAQLTGDYDQMRNLLSPEENARRLQEEYDFATRTGGRLSDSAALATQQQLQALQDQIASQRKALTDELATLQGAVGTAADSRRAALATEIAALDAAAQKAATSRTGALDAETAALLAAQDPVSRSRLDTANALASGVNLGLEGERDRLTAQRARQGYLGSSTFSDAAMGRAAIGARQQAAQVMGGARQLNAEDLRTINARAATEGRGIADWLTGAGLDIAGRSATGTRGIADDLTSQTLGITGQGAADTRTLADLLASGTGTLQGNLATQQQGARDATTRAQQGYFDNAYTRLMGSLLTRPDLAGNLTRTLGGIEDYGTSGANRALNTLNWWATNQGTPPTPGYTPAVVNTTGNDIAGLGANLFGAGLNYANAQNWWQPRTTTTTTTAPAATAAANAGSGSSWWDVGG